MTREYLLIEITSSKEVQDLTDKAAGRIYTLDSVEDVSAMRLTSDQAMRLAMVEAEMIRRG